MGSESLEFEVLCTNCDAPLSGEYCAACGQRRFRHQDRTLGHLLGSFFGAITDLDGRFWRSIKAVLFRPGLIARDYIDGRRAHWISPIRMFLLANLLYFIAPGVTDLNLPLEYHMRGQLMREFDPSACAQGSLRVTCEYAGTWYSGLAEPWLRPYLQHAQAESQRRGTLFSIREVSARYSARAESLGKLLVIVHVPFVAAALWLLAWKRRNLYAGHFVVALGMVTFMLLFVQLIFGPASEIYVWVLQRIGATSTGAPWWAVLALVLINVGHFSLACRCCYNSRWLITVVQGLFAFVALAAVSIWVYRPLQFVLSLWLME